MATPPSTLDKLELMQATSEPQNGLLYWMKQVLVRADDASKDFSSSSVHALRTSLRRCRSMAEGIRTFDPDTVWKKMRRAGKELFSSLGALRDTHVMIDWVEKLFDPGDPTSEKLLSILRERERRQQKAAAQSLEQFDRKQWEKWTADLPARAVCIPPNNSVFAHLAVERWHHAHRLHSHAMRNRSSRAFHDLRIGIKHFRYTVENFLPALYESWGDSLKDVQDLLGEVHDLDVLWQAATAERIFSDPQARLLWRSHLSAERMKRVAAYRAIMVGRVSEWSKWRAGLPADDALRPLAMERIETWASFADPDFTHARHVAHLSQQLYRTVPSNGIIRTSQRRNSGEILQFAALMHHAGRSRSNRGHHKLSARMIRKLAPPRGIRPAELRLAALIARYHRGALPRETQPRYAALSPSRRRVVQFLAGILRLACACDRAHDARIRSLRLDSSTPAWTLIAEGYDAAAPFAEHLAAARHLLELACGHPILIVPARSLASQAA